MIEIPLDFKKVLRTDAKANVAFTKLPPSHQRRYVAWIGEVKRPETRAKRIDQAIKRIVAAEGGYSGKLLASKLGIKPRQQIVIINPPENYRQLLEPLPEAVTIASEPTGLREFIQFFSTDHAQIEEQFPKLKDRLAPIGQLWVSWPKGTSRIKTDLNENIIRDIGLANGLVDVKVIAIDRDWSGLKFVFRTKDRPNA